jgi:tRNA(fMet)-specific endonuclease VapC
MSHQVMLATNIVSHLLRFPEGVVSEKLKQLGEGAACVSVIISAELPFGARRINSARVDSNILRILSVIPALPLEPPVDDVYAGVRSDLQAKGTVISPNDMLIAAHALTLDLTLVTANTREFSRVPGLRVENWRA